VLSRSEIADNLHLVQSRIADAAVRVGRNPDDVALVTVTKTRGLEEIEAVIEAGATDLGENYVQEMVAKAEQMPGAPVTWHAIGHLQSKKARQVAPVVSVLHSVDSLKLALEMDKRAEAAGREVLALIQVNVAGEETKFGVDEAGLFDLAPQLVELDNARLAGLMTMPPYADDADASRPHFARLRLLREELIERGISAHRLGHLSMGMTSDYEVAVEEGATLVRVGTAIFGPRD